jgi:guanylate kinase
MTVKPIIICGCSGVGKGTLIKRLMDEYPTKFAFSVSHTTRAPRNGEIDGVHYHFTTKESIFREIEKGLFLQHVHVHNNLYESSFKAVKYVSPPNANNSEPKGHITCKLRSSEISPVI